MNKSPVQARCHSCSCWEERNGEDNPTWRHGGQLPDKEGIFRERTKKHKALRNSLLT